MQFVCLVVHFIAYVGVVLTHFTIYFPCFLFLSHEICLCVVVSSERKKNEWKQQERRFRVSWSILWQETSTHLSYLLVGNLRRDSVSPNPYNKFICRRLVWLNIKLISWTTHRHIAVWCHRQNSIYIPVIRTRLVSTVRLLSFAVQPLGQNWVDSNFKWIESYTRWRNNAARNASAAVQNQIEIVVRCETPNGAETKLFPSRKQPSVFNRFSTKPS